MHETCLVIIHDPGMRLGLESNRGARSRWFNSALNPMMLPSVCFSEEQVQYVVLHPTLFCLSSILLHCGRPVLYSPNFPQYCKRRKFFAEVNLSAWPFVDMFLCQQIWKIVLIIP